MPQKPLSLKPPPSPVRKKRGVVLCRNGDGHPVVNPEGQGAERRICPACFEVMASSAFGR